MIRLALLNHLLAQRSDLRALLQRHAGRSAAILTPPLALRFAIGDNGFLEDSTQVAEATVSISPLLLPRLALQDPSAAREVELSGDAQLAGDIARLLQQLDWDAEADMARLMGDVAAHRLTETARQWLGDPRRILRNVGESSIEYLESEARMIASKSALNHFASAVDTLRDDAARLEKRLQALEARTQSPS